MNAISIPPVVMATLMFYVGFYHFLIYRRQKDKRENLTFALTCFSVGLYSICCAGLYSVSSPIEGVQWQRFQVITLAILGAALLWFIYDYTGQANRKIVIGFTVYYVFAALSGIFYVGDLIWTNEASIKEITLPFGYDIRYYEMVPGVLTNLQSIVGLIYFIYILKVSLKFYKSGNKKKGMPLLAAVAILFVGLMNDTFVSSGFYSFIYILEYSYIGIILVFTYFLTNIIIKSGEIEIALHKSEAKFRGLVESSSDWIWEVNAEGVYTYASPQVEAILGYKPEEVVGKTPFDLMPPEEAERIALVFKGLLEAGKPIVTLENVNLDKDGQRVVLETSSVPVFDAAGKVTGFRGIDRNVTERKRAEEELQKSEEKHRKLVSNISDVIVILDKDGIITYKSSNITEQFGWKPDDLIGKHGLFTVHLDDQERIGKELAPILKKDKAKVRVEYKYICKDGSNRPVELTAVNMVNDPVINGVLCNYKDITERKYSEEILKQSEEKYRTMIERSNDMIWTLDISGNFTFFNKQTEEVTGLKLKEWIGKSFVPLIFEEDLPMIMDIFKKGLKGESAQYELRFRKQENEILTISVNTAPLMTGGTVSGVLNFGRDITGRKLAEKEKANLEAQLRQAQKMESIGTLAGGIAHDFNNILFPMFGYLEMMLEDVPEDNPLRGKLAEVFNGAIRARDLVRQILTFSRQTEIEKKPLKMQLVIKEVLKLIHSSLPTTIDIYQDISNECEFVMADPTQVHQIAMNLITNAYHAMEETGGKLTVNLKEVELTAEDIKDPAMIPGPHACLTIADTGSGMDQGIIARIFDPYFTTKENGKGTGLGLAVVHGIVKSHGGHISVYSEPGKGAEFKVYLPVIKEQKETSKVDIDTPIQKGDERILLVDDQDIIVQIEKQMLERLGYHVTARTSSIDALEAFRMQPDNFDLVITDLTMPNMTGDKLAVELIKIRSDIPVILCTGFSELMSKEKAESLGIEGFLMKPVVIKDLSSMIRKVLDKQ